MTEDVLSALKTAEKHLTNNGLDVGDIRAEIRALELGDLAPVREAFEAARAVTSWYSSSFDERSDGMKRFLKAFYDAARKDPEPVTFKPGDRVIITGDSMSSGHHFEAGERGKIIVVESDSSYQVEYENGHDYWWVHPNDLKLNTEPRVFNSPADAPTDIKLKDSDGDIWSFVDGRWQYGEGYGRYWEPDDFDGDYTEIL